MIILFILLCCWLQPSETTAISFAILLLADVILLKDFEIKVKIKNEKTCEHTASMEDRAH